QIGYNVKIGYFAQNQAQLLDESLTVFQTIDNVAVGDVRMRIKDILGAFMFGGEESDKKVKVLSGGERSRLAMIKLLLEPVNFLILDEPTNHLDMDSKDVLKEAIKAFDGTVIIVSHDREFLDGLVTKVYEFGGGRVKEHLGGVYDFLRAKAISSLDELGVADTAKPNNQQTAKKEKAAEAVKSELSYAERKERNKKISRYEKLIKESETRIEGLEDRLKELDEILSKPENAVQIDLCSEYATIRQALDKEMENWEQLSETLFNLQQE
ncbi:MAG: ATP-binding cassette domain-containing protein, partial [Prevotellaceae bacterium]|nr:ATP-binding cassette domain-containing protein [Prevotellaceae bacterium]